jgi:hypothetical protein
MKGLEWGMNRLEGWITGLEALGLGCGSVMLGI